MKLSNSQWKDFVRTRVLRDKSNLIKDHHNLRLAAKVCLKRIPLDNKLLTRVRVNVQRLSLKSSPVLRPLVVHLVREDFSGMAPSKNGRKKGTKGSESKSETRRYGGTKTEDKENKVNSTWSDWLILIFLLHTHSTLVKSSCPKCVSGP